jgi:hypothetical protein
MIVVCKSDYSALKKGIEIAQTPLVPDADTGRSDTKPKARIAAWRTWASVGGRLSGRWRIHARLAWFGH